MNTPEAINSVMKGVDIEDRTHENHQWKDNDQRSNNLVDQQDSIIIKLSSHLIHEPSQSEPPQQSTEKNACKTDSHFELVIGYNESELCKQRHKHKNDKRIRESY